MKWGSAFRVVAHELRSPAGVIAGYARMLMSGRLDEASQQEAFKQMERAAGRLGDLAQQSSDLAGWFEPNENEHQTLPIASILNYAAQASAAPARVRVISNLRDGDLSVRSREPRALSAAIATLINATEREMPTRNAEIGVTARPSGRDGFCDVLVGAPALIVGLPIDVDLEHASSAFNLESGGLGLHLILGAVVLEAHGASLWASRDVRGVTGVRIPVDAGN